jgi:hypothetical protein
VTQQGYLICIKINKNTLRSITAIKEFPITLNTTKSKSISEISIKLILGNKGMKNNTNKNWMT